MRAVWAEEGEGLNNVTGIRLLSRFPEAIQNRILCGSTPRSLCPAGHTCPFVVGSIVNACDFESEGTEGSRPLYRAGREYSTKHNRPL